jgi:A/G-specific adenine glycosylase
MSVLPSSSTVAAALERWFSTQGKDYPWRRTRDPYAILVSEVMLQQTQIATVLAGGYYQNWIDRFPDFHSLAEASEEEVLKAWEGLGYYRRARNLQRLARVIVSDHAGEMPRDHKVIMSLPGIGPYTAGAIASFAFDDPMPLVDGNVARVLSRLFDDETPIDSKRGTATLWERAAQLVSAAASPRVLNSALMELGQTICRTGTPECLVCPLKAECRTTRASELPVKAKRTALTDVEEHAFFLLQEGAVLLERETGSRRTGMWKLPTLGEANWHLPVIHESRYGITRYRVKLFVHTAPVPLLMAKAQRWIRLSELAAIVMPSPYRRALESILTG